MIATRPGDKTQPNGSVLGVQMGPMKGRNWFGPDNPQYAIVQNGTGVISLQGTNNEALTNDLRDNQTYSPDLLPAYNATWTTIDTGAGNISGTFSVEYRFLQLVLTATGTGTVTSAWVRWN